MNASDLLALVRSVDQQVASLYGQLISINIAMIVAIYYFLNRAGLVFKFFAFVVYAVGMLAFWGMMLRESNVKSFALQALAHVPRADAPLPALAYLDLSTQWLFEATSVFLNLGIWLMWASTAFLLFFWRKPANS